MSSAFDGVRKFTATGVGKAADAAGQSDGQGAGLVSAAGKTASGLVYSEVGPVQEFQIGKSVAARVLPLYPVLPSTDPRAVYVNALGAAIVAASNDPMPYKGYQFVMLDSDEVNAFAVPGGFVFVTTGMLKFLTSSATIPRRFTTCLSASRPSRVHTAARAIPPSAARTC